MNTHISVQPEKQANTLELIQFKRFYVEIRTDTTVVISDRQIG